MRFSCLALSSVVALASGALTSHNETVDALEGSAFGTFKSTWGKFYSIPQSDSDAADDKWDKVMTCDSAGSPGIVYAQNGDVSTLPVYTDGGDVYGVIMGVSDLSESFQTAPFQEFTLDDGTSFWGLLTIYEEPGTACSSSLSSHDELKSFGSVVRIADGNSGTYLEPSATEDEDALAADGWVKGACFKTMGVHYWRYVSSDMDCNDIYPIFLLYNGGKLNGFGVAFSHDDMTSDGLGGSSRWESPPTAFLPMFFQSESFPKCLSKTGVSGTQHIFMTNPLTAWC